MSEVATTHLSRIPRVLSIAGTDPSGGAGTAADIKSITAAGGYAMAVVTVLVAQNTRGVRELHAPPAEFLTAQLEAVSDDVEIDVVKTGMLGAEEIIAAVRGWLASNRPKVLVVDPVMVATSGDRLLDEQAEQSMVDFCRSADVVTPNTDELALLVGAEPARDEHEALEQGLRWARETGVDVVVKTGHLDGRLATNTWVRPDGTTFPVPSVRIDTANTHGTGCSLASAIATRLGHGDSPNQALEWSTAWLHEAISHGSRLEVGKGHGPVDHSHRARRLGAAGSANPWLAPGTVPDLLEEPEDLPGAAAGWRATAAVKPAGPWTQALWAAAAGTIGAVADSAFVRALVEGTLPRPSFDFYLAQDALYLARYSRVLAALSAASTDKAAQEFWARGALTCLTVESELHRGWLGAGSPGEPSPVTSAYTDFLLATVLGDDRAVGCAAVLPCYWLYAQTGATLPAVPDAHPYAAWLDTYRDQAFVTATEGALAQVEREMASASPAARAAAARAFLLACRHELEFFDQALRVEPESRPHA